MLASIWSSFQSQICLIQQIIHRTWNCRQVLSDNCTDRMFKHLQCWLENEMKLIHHQRPSQWDNHCDSLPSVLKSPLFIFLSCEVISTLIRIPFWNCAGNLDRFEMPWAVTPVDGLRTSTVVLLEDDAFAKSSSFASRRLRHRVMSYNYDLWMKV